MTEASKPNTLSNATVKEAMRVQVLSLLDTQPISQGIRHLIKYKVNAFLVSSPEGSPIGVVSKTDIVGAFYTGIPLESPLGSIMVSPPIYCSPADSLESALQTMRSLGIYRLYVLSESGDKVVGVLAYPDIVGLLYGYCRACDRSLMNRQSHLLEKSHNTRIRVREVMKGPVVSYSDEDELSNIIEGLSEHRCGAVLIKSSSDVPIGVISKTDLVLAYKRGMDVRTRANEVRSFTGVISCEQNEYLEDALRKMITSDLQRLFVWTERTDNIVGVISLSDAARIRSGSCHACISSRIKIE